MVMRFLAIALPALLLAGCEVYAVPNPVDCPGVSQGTFDFAADQVVNPPPSCFYAQQGNSRYQVLPTIGFQGVIAFAQGSSEAAVCRSAAHAVPNVGSYSTTPVPNGTLSTVDVASSAVVSVGLCNCTDTTAAVRFGCLCPPNTPNTCSCPLLQEQRITGVLTDVTVQPVARFDGTLLYNVIPAGPDGPDPINPPCDCQVPCSYSYKLGATQVGAR